jgi:hypothetical protein
VVALADFRNAVVKTFAEEWALTHLAPDALLATWWVFSQITDENVEEAKAALTGAAGDGGVDAVRADPSAKVVYLIQCKLRKKLESIEAEADLARLGRWHGLLAGDDEAFDEALTGVMPATRDRLVTARRFVNRDRYRIELQFVTTGHASEVSVGHQPVSFRMFNGRQVLQLFDDFASGVRPIQELQFPVGAHSAASATSGGIGLAVYLVKGNFIRQAVLDHGDRLFARNVRGYLGTSAAVNDAIIQTVRNDAERFRYMNNGLTIVCDSAPVTRNGNRHTLTLTNPQVVNGQQTSRSIAAVTAREAGKVQVIAKVVAIDREKIESRAYDGMVRDLVEATNLQSKINIADLRSNDKRQVELGRAFRRLGHYYARKTEPVSAYRAKANGYPLILRSHLADAVGGALVESLPHRLTKDAMYEDPTFDLIFDEREAERGLLCYYLWKAVRDASKPGRVSAVRAQGKWLVQFLLWRELEDILTKGFRTFVRHGSAARPDADLSAALSDVINRAGLLVEAFYRSEWRNRGVGNDPVRFFKLAGLSPALDAFATGAGAPAKARFERAMQQLGQALSD